jgi:hypothetical protein
MGSILELIFSEQNVPAAADLLVDKAGGARQPNY